MNRKSAALCLNQTQLQVLYSGKLGDGHFTKSTTSYYVTSCIHKEYIQFKESILKDTLNVTYKPVNNNGYCKKTIYILTSASYKELNLIRDMCLSDILNELNEFGIALWFMDDGSLHKNKLFYNLSTHSFSKEDQINHIIPFFNRYNIFPKLTKELKSDGRVYYYLRIGKYDGAYLISELIKKLDLNCFEYKTWSSEASQRWRKLQEELKSTNKTINDFSKRMLNAKMNKYVL